jgi:ribosome-associated protein
MKLTDEIKKLLENEIRYSSSRSSGPGGQNVNKVNTQVELRFSVTETVIFSEDEKSRILEKLKNKINSAGELILTSQESRTQLENKELVTIKFFSMVESALRVRRARIKTAPSLASVKQRLETKKNKSVKKQLRKPPEL